MRRISRKGPWLVAGLLLAATGVGVGAVASSLTSASIDWRPPARFATTEPINHEAIDQGQAGRSWARVAFDGGLRRCPEMNAGFLAACEAEMKALADRPALVAGSYGGPLLITKVERVPEPDYEEYRPEAEPIVPLKATDYGHAPPPVLPREAITPANYPAATHSRPQPALVPSEVEGRMSSIGAPPLDYARDERISAAR